MGMFSGGGKKTSISTAVTNTNNQNTGFSDVAGSAIALQGDNNYIKMESLDADLAYSAINSARDASEAASDTVSAVADAAFRYGASAANSATGVASEALALGRDSVLASVNVSADALAMGYEFGRDALGSYTDVVRESLNNVEWNNQLNAQQVERALASVDSANTSDSAETLQSVGKWLAIAIAVVGVVGIWGKN